jgi:hypothetical protein
MTNGKFLRTVLLLDAAATAATGLLMLLGGRALSGPLNLPAELMQATGLLLLPGAAFVYWLARRPSPSRPAVLAVVVVNLLYVADCVLLLAGGFVAPTTLGVAFVLAQALAVGALAAAQAALLPRGANVTVAA